MIEACERQGGPGLAPIQSLLWRLVAEAAREDAREFAEDSAHIVPPRWIVSRLDAPNYAPLLIEAVAAALEDFEAPPVEAPCDPLELEVEENPAPPVEAPSVSLDAPFEDGPAPPVQLPWDMLAALAAAA